MKKSVIEGKQNRREKKKIDGKMKWNKQSQQHQQQQTRRNEVFYVMKIKTRTKDELNESKLFSLKKLQENGWWNLRKSTFTILSRSVKKVYDNCEWD